MSNNDTYWKLTYNPQNEAGKRYRLTPKKIPNGYNEQQIKDLLLECDRHVVALIKNSRGRAMPAPEPKP